MENLYLWIGLGITFLIIISIYFSVTMSRKRAREVADLNQYFPDRPDQSITTRRSKLNSPRQGELDNKGDIKKEDVKQEEEKEKEKEKEPASVQQESNSTQVGQDDKVEESGKPIRYRKSIFHPDHLKMENEGSKGE